MKTAMQELKERLLIDKRDFPENKQIQSTLLDIEELLQTEKQQINDAVKYGFNDATKPSSDQDITFQQYYYETFETNKETLK